MHIIFHVLCLIVGGFLAMWAISLNDLRYAEESTYSAVVISLMMIGLLALALGVANLYV